MATNSLSVVSSFYENSDEARNKWLHSHGVKRDESVGMDGPTICKMAHGVDLGVIPLVEPVSREEFAEQQAAWDATKERGRPPRWRAVEFVVAGHHIIEQKPDDAKRWAAGVKDELLRIYPSVKWQAVALHADETSWHVHAFGQPWGKDAKGKLRRGKAAMLREAESVLLERPIRKASLTPKQLSVFGSKFQQHMDAKLGQPFGMTPITPGGKETSRKRDEKMDIIERRLAYAREREELADQRGIESNAKAERREAEALANAAQIEREAQARVAELERQADAAAAKRDQAVNADIEAIVKQSLSIKLRPRAHIRYLERKVEELEGEIERLKNANEQEAEAHRRELADVRQRLIAAEQDAEKYHRRARLDEIERQAEAQRPKPLPPPPTPPPTFDEIAAELREKAAKRKIKSPLVDRYFGPAGDIHGIEADEPPVPSEHDYEVRLWPERGRDG